MTVPSGINETRWDGLSSGGSAVATGVYYVRVRSGRLSSVKKIIRL
jgi:hypothetical protein